MGGLAVCLRFCRPFLEKADKKQGALQVGDGRRYRRAAREQPLALAHACLHSSK